MNNEILNKQVNQDFEYYCKKILFLSPSLTDEEAHYIYQKFVEFYLNGDAVFSQRNAYQLIEVSNLILLWMRYLQSWYFMVAIDLRTKGRRVKSSGGEGGIRRRGNIDSNFVVDGSGILTISQHDIKLCITTQYFLQWRH